MWRCLQMSGFRATKSGDAYRLEQKFEEVQNHLVLLNSLQGVVSMGAYKKGQGVLAPGQAASVGLGDLLAVSQLNHYYYCIQPFYGPLSGTTRVSWYQKKHSPTHLSWSSSNVYQLLPFTTTHSIFPVQFTCLTIFLHNLCPSSVVYLLVWSPSLILYHKFIHPISACLLFATHAHTILQPVLL